MNSRSSYQTVKRAIDIAVASVGLLVSWPVLVAGGIAVKLDSPGPVLYKGRRVGRGGAEFELLKLRTMVVAPAGSGLQVTSGADHRITRVGRLLRTAKLDELPQLLNVLKGDISLVGPRPESPVYVKHFPKEYERILSIRPGLTDWATLEYLDEEEILGGSSDPEKTYVEEVLPKKIAKYLEYLESQSLSEDLGILTRTAFRVAARSARATRCALNGLHIENPSVQSSGKPE